VGNKVATFVHKVTRSIVDNVGCSFLQRRPIALQKVCTTIVDITAVGVLAICARRALHLLDFEVGVVRGCVQMVLPGWNIGVYTGELYLIRFRVSHFYCVCVEKRSGEIKLHA
jgi:hypothetical protein